MVAESVRNARCLKKRKAEHSAIASLTLPQSEAGMLTSLWSGVSQEQVNEAWARLCYANAIPFSLMESPWFKSALDVTISYVRGWKGYTPPLRQAVATKYLDREKTRTSDALIKRLFGPDPTMSAGKIACEYGLSITSDGWS